MKRLTMPLNQINSRGLLAPLSPVFTAAMLTALVGCTVGPDYKGPPEIKTGATFSSLAGGDVDKANATIKPTSAAPLSVHDLATWWKSFNDPALDSLIQRAIASNLDLKIAAARVREARALRGIEESGLYPTVDVGASAAREQSSRNFKNFGGTVSSDSTSLFQAGVDASWEIDVFGGVRRSIQAADATLQATQEAQRDTLVTLIAEVARNYCELRGFQQRIDVNTRAIQAQRETLELTQSLSNAGISSELQVQQSATQLSARQSQLHPLLVGARRSAHRLAVLLAQEPGALLGELAASGAIPQPPTEIPVGLPSDILRRRPDIRRAERNIKAASARIGVATSDLFPKFSITGRFGYESDEPNTFFNLNSRYWSIGPAVRWNVFDAHRVRNQIKAANAREEQSEAEYENTVLVALEDVENSLTSFIQEQARWRELTNASESSKKALDLATERYKSGIGDFLNVLDAQRAQYELQDQLVQSELSVTSSLIAVYKALGGGWDDQIPAANDQPAPAQTPQTSPQ